MGRGARRFEHWRARRESFFSPEASRGELDLRDRAGRQIRARLRQMQPTVLLTPRWSKPRDFMESLSLEMAVAEPAMALCLDPMPCPVPMLVSEWVCTCFAPFSWTSRRIFLVGAFSNAPLAPILVRHGLLVKGRLVILGLDPAVLRAGRRRR